MSQNSRNQGFSYYSWWWKDPDPDYLWLTDPDHWVGTVRYLRRAWRRQLTSGVGWPLLRSLSALAYTPHSRRGTHTFKSRKVMPATVLMEGSFEPTCCWGDTFCAAKSHATSPLVKFGNDNTKKEKIAPATPCSSKIIPTVTLKHSTHCKCWFSKDRIYGTG